jgi:hypothetical protein
MIPFYVEALVLIEKAGEGGKEPGKLAEELDIEFNNLGAILHFLLKYEKVAKDECGRFYAIPRKTSVFFRDVLPGERFDFAFGTGFAGHAIKTEEVGIAYPDPVNRMSNYVLIKTIFECVGGRKPGSHGHLDGVATVFVYR